MKEIKCPNCGGIVCRATTPPVEASCSSCHKISLFDGSSDIDKAREMTVEESLKIKSEYFIRRKSRKTA